MSQAIGWVGGGWNVLFTLCKVLLIWSMCKYHRTPTGQTMQMLEMLLSTIAGLVQTESMPTPSISIQNCSKAHCVMKSWFKATTLFGIISRSLCGFILVLAQGTRLSARQTEAIPPVHACPRCPEAVLMSAVKLQQRKPTLPSRVFFFLFSPALIPTSVSVSMPEACPAWRDRSGGLAHHPLPRPLVWGQIGLIVIGLIGSQSNRVKNKLHLHDEPHIVEIQEIFKLFLGIIFDYKIQPTLL